MAITAANAAVRFASKDGTPSADGLSRETSVDHSEEAVDRLNAETGGHGIIMVDRGIYDYNVASSANTNNFRMVGTGQGNGTTDHAVLRATSDVSVFDYSAYSDWQHGWGLHSVVVSGNNVASRASPLVINMRPGFGFTMDDIYFRDIPASATCFPWEVRNGANNCRVGHIEFASRGAGCCRLWSSGAPGVAFGYNFWAVGWQIDTGGQIPIKILVDGSAAGGFKSTFNLGFIETENTTAGHMTPVVDIENGGSTHGYVRIDGIKQSTDVDSVRNKILVRDQTGRFRVEIPGVIFGHGNSAQTAFVDTVGVGSWPFGQLPGNARFGNNTNQTGRVYDMGDGSTQVTADHMIIEVFGPGLARWCGTGDPGGVIPGLRGTEYTRTDGGVGSTKWVKTSSTGPTDKTGWTAYA